MSIELRKEDHINLALRPENQGPMTTLLEDVVLLHQPLVDISLDDVSLEVDFLGYRLGAPIMITAITGGTSRAYEINKALADAAERYRLAIGVGSQRAMLINRDSIYTYKVVREIAHSIPVVANIGIAQLIKLDISMVEWIVESIEADALAVHINVLHELIQLEGDRDFRGSLKAIKSLVDRIDVPVIVKEVGAGMPRECVETLYSLGVRIVDVAGSGGTNWVSIELARSNSDDYLETYELFKTWGMPTAASIVEAASVEGVTVIGSGGIRSGLDIAKAIALGAYIAGMAQPFLYHVVNNTVIRFVERILAQLKAVMLLTNSRTVEELRSAKTVILGRLAYWICARRLRLRNANAYIFCSQMT